VKYYYIPPEVSLNPALSGIFRSIFFVAVLFFSMLLVTACQPEPHCTDPDGCWYFSPREDIGIGTDQSSVEPARSDGIEILRGLEIFLTTQPDFAGHPLKILEQSVRCFPGQVENDISQFTGLPNAIAFIGPACQLDADHSLRLLSDAGIPILSPLTLEAEGDFSSWLLLSQSTTLAAASAANLMAEHFSASSIGWIIENTPAQREFQAALCQKLEGVGRTCLEPVLVDVGVVNLSPYLSAPLQEEAPVWVFLYSSVSFSNLSDMNSLLKKTPCVLLDPNSDQPDLSRSPLASFYFIGQPPTHVPQEFALSYEKRYNGQNTLISFKSYQAAGMIFQALENSAILLKDKGVLLPRLAFEEEISAHLPATAGLCLTPIQSYQFNIQDQECP
jgi:hypothetical protein